MVTQWALAGKDMIDEDEHESCCVLRLLKMTFHRPERACREGNVQSANRTNPRADAFNKTLKGVCKAPYWTFHNHP